MIYLYNRKNGIFAVTIFNMKIFNLISSYFRVKNIQRDVYLCVPTFERVELLMTIGYP